MAPSVAVRTPTAASLPHATQVPSTTRPLVKLLSKLSRDDLIDLAIDWLKKDNQPACAPYLASNRTVRESEEEDYAFPPAESVEELQAIYTRLKEDTGAKRDLIDRILDGDWRRGLSLYQLASIDFRHLEAHDASLRWSALKVVSLDGNNHEQHTKKRLSRSGTDRFPRLHPHTFLRNLEREVAPVVKAHYCLYRLKSHPLTIIRLYVTDSPYKTARPAQAPGLIDSSRTLFLAFPEGCPFIYVSLSGPLGFITPQDRSETRAHDIASLKKIVLEAVPRALSRPHQRYGLQSTSLSAKSLSTLCELRGPGKQNASSGAFSVFANGFVDHNPLELDVQPIIEPDIADTFEAQTYGGGQDNTSTVLDQPSGKRRHPLSARDGNAQVKDTDDSKRRKIVAAKRFGAPRAPKSDSHGFDRLQIKMAGPLTGSQGKHASPDAGTDGDTGHGSCPISLTFHGANVFAGVRQLVEAGLVKAERMPVWMTGEECVSHGVVREGQMFGGMGGGA